jgi:hypothetical protein
MSFFDRMMEGRDAEPVPEIEEQRQAADRWFRLVFPFVVLVVPLLALGYSLLPFKAIGVKCKPSWSQAKPTAIAPTSYLRGKEGPVCESEGNSRLVTAGFIALLASAAGAVAGAAGQVGPEEGARLLRF